MFNGLEIEHRGKIFLHLTTGRTNPIRMIRKKIERLEAEDRKQKQKVNR